MLETLFKSLEWNKEHTSSVYTLLQGRNWLQDKLTVSR